jgi:hypothetical protein
LKLKDSLKELKDKKKKIACICWLGKYSLHKEWWFSGWKLSKPLLIMRQNIHTATTYTTDKPLLNTHKNTHTHTHTHTHIQRTQIIICSNNRIIKKICSTSFLSLPTTSFANHLLIYWFIDWVIYLFIYLGGFHK